MPLSIECFGQVFLLVHGDLVAKSTAARQVEQPYAGTVPTSYLHDYYEYLCNNEATERVTCLIRETVFMPENK